LLSVREPPQRIAQRYVPPLIVAFSWGPGMPEGFHAPSWSSCRCRMPRATDRHHSWNAATMSRGWSIVIVLGCSLPSQRECQPSTGRTCNRSAAWRDLHGRPFVYHPFNSTRCPTDWPKPSTGRHWSEPGERQVGGGDREDSLVVGPFWRTPPFVASVQPMQLYCTPGLALATVNGTRFVMVTPRSWPVEP